MAHPQRPVAQLEFMGEFFGLQACESDLLVGKVGLLY